MRQGSGGEEWSASLPAVAVAMEATIHSMPPDMLKLASMVGEERSVEDQTEWRMLMCTTGKEVRGTNPFGARKSREEARAGARTLASS